MNEKTKERAIKGMTVGISGMVSIAAVTGTYIVLGVNDAALETTFIAILSAAIALDVYPRLVNRFKVQQGTS